MTSLTKKPHPPSKKIFCRVQTRRLAVSYDASTRSVTSTRTEISQSDAKMLTKIFGCQNVNKNFQQFFGCQNVNKNFQQSEPKMLTKIFSNFF